MAKANRARLARERAGLTIGQAATLLGIEKQHLVIVEELDPAQADFDFTKLAELYQCRIEWITGEVEQHDYARLDALPGADRLTPHDRKVIAEFIAMIPRKPAKKIP